jgi:hypothetical protein
MIEKQPTYEAQIPKMYRGAPEVYRDERMDLVVDRC